MHVGGSCSTFSKNANCHISQNVDNASSFTWIFLPVIISTAWHASDKDANRKLMPSSNTPFMNMTWKSFCFLLRQKHLKFFYKMMQMSTSLTFMGSSIVDITQDHLSSDAEAGRVSSYQFPLRWSLCINAALGWCFYALLRALQITHPLLSGYVLLLIDCTAWTCWRRLLNSASQACSSADVLVVSQPRTSSIASTPLLTIIYRQTGECSEHHADLRYMYKTINPNQLLIWGS